MVDLFKLRFDVPCPNCCAGDHAATAVGHSADESGGRTLSQHGSHGQNGGK